MTQQNLRELLKQGDPKAIASSINRTLKPKGINADVTRDNGCLHITLESGKVPSQMALVDFIRSGMTNLGVESIHTVKVYGRRTGDGSPAWEDEIDLMPADPMLYASDTGMPDDSVGLDDVEPDGEDYYQEGQFDPDDNEEDDEEDDEEDEDEDVAPPPKKQFPKWAIPVGILVPLGAIAALYLTGNFPFGGGSNPEPSAPEAASPSPKKATSPASKATSPSPSASGEAPQAASPPAPKAAPTTAAAPGSPVPKPPAPKAASPAPKAASPAPKAASPAPKAAAPKPDSWREGVNNAQKAAVLAQTAQSQAEWIAVASEWQKAVQLMRAVPSTSPNHSKAQQKAAEYQANLIVANRRAAAAP
ncbi:MULTISPECIES: hypothetical protein [unclassified Microcoleus]|uniref:hypothetical protein n=1 Tax=unclassified Microcoleus TaxID=2642155 RepID=UPI0025F3791F|nr:MULTISPECIES: hypothetical protein [unclassified Microcoleus]